MSQETNTPTQPQQPAAPQGVDPELIKQAIQEGFQNVQQQQSAPRQRTVEDMTPAERAKYFEIFDPSQDNFHEKFAKAINEADSPEERSKVLAEYRDGIVNQSLRGAEIMMEQKFSQFQQQFAPAQQFAQQHQREALWEQFKAKHPDLEPSRDLVDAVATQLSASGFRPKTPDEAFSKIAETAKGILTKSGVTLPAANTNGNARPPMAQMSSRGNTGGAQQPTSPEGQRLASFWNNRKR